MARATHHRDGRFSGSHSAHFLLLAAMLAFLALWPVILRADGGRVIDSVSQDGLKITVMASPWPLRAGPSDIGVFVQSATGEPLLDADVFIGWSSQGAGGEAWVPPCCRMKPSDGLAPASRSHGQNRLVYSSLLSIGRSGPGLLEVVVRHGTTESSLAFPIEVATPPPPFLTYFPWLAITPLAIGGFVLHQHVSRQRSSPATTPDSPGTPRRAA